jgi:RND family efflux transporter MFP subunit
MKIWLLIGFSLLLGACGHSSEERKANAPAAAVSVSAMPATRAEWPTVYDATGTVRARTASVLSAKVMGYVRDVNVSVGDYVKTGQTLVVLDARDLDSAIGKVVAMQEEIRSTIPEVENGVAGAKAQLELAQVTFKRMDDLFKKKSISNQELDEASARLRGAEANYRMALSKRKQLDARMRQVEHEQRSAEIMRGYSEVRAPYDAVVTERQAEPGTLATPGAPLVKLERAGSYRLEVPVEESRVSLVRQGQQVRVELEALGRSLIGKVSEIVPAVDAMSRTYTVKIDLPGLPQLKSGMFGRAQFAVGTHSVVAVPENAVVERGQLQSIYVAEGGFVRNRLVTTGRKHNGYMEVLSGLDAAEAVIAPIPAGLKDGMKVEVR